LLLALLAFTRTAGGSDRLELSGKATNETRMKKISLPSSELSTKAHLNVKALLESGQAALVLRDPNGKARLTGRVTRGNITLDSGELEAIKGTWILQIEMRNATLDYEIRWRTN
jgi:hypothetical protein